MSTKFKPGDKLLNIGYGFNSGKRATVLAVNPAGFPDAPECDLLLHAPDAMMLHGEDGLYKEHKMYSVSEFWKKEE